MNKNNTSEKLLTALIEMASQKGLDNISLSMLASQLNISKSTIFSHYKNKEELVDKMYIKGKTLTLNLGMDFSFKGDAKSVLTRAVDYWHTVYSSISSFHRIVEMQKYIDERAMNISLSMEAMIKAQAQIVIEQLNDTERLNIDDLDFAVECFSTTITKYLQKEMLDNGEDFWWQEERFINRFYTAYKA
ncbi:MAG: TetR/AcrR family transcriptional regulator [Sphaerochaetaceae bacterium]|jgi:AcrR family transcriptional regulator|nr:TetR/AcrR family transcriptional regulator [Sphaerochaetaceae bacterium]